MTLINEHKSWGTATAIAVFSRFSQCRFDTCGCFCLIEATGNSKSSTKPADKTLSSKSAFQRFMKRLLGRSEPSNEERIFQNLLLSPHPESEWSNIAKGPPSYPAITEAIRQNNAEKNESPKVSSDGSHALSTGNQR
jgi:hypothetical protein